MLWHLHMTYLKDQVKKYIAFINETFICTRIIQRIRTVGIALDVYEGENVCVCMFVYVHEPHTYFFHQLSIIILPI